MKKYVLTIFLMLTITFLGCNNPQIDINNKVSKINNYKHVKNETDSSNKDEVKLDILVSNPFLYNCVKSIDGGKHEVDYIFNRSNDEVMIRHYYDINYVPDLFIYDEFNFSELNNTYISNIEGNRVGIINGSRGVNQLSYYKNVNKYGEGKECLFWNNIDNYKVVLVNVKNAIVERDPRNRSYYEENFSNILKSLVDYEKAFKKEGSKVKDYTFIVEGSYLDYIMAYSGLKTISISEDYEKKKNVAQLDKIIEQKYSTNKDKMIFIYYNDDFLNKNKSTILKYNIKCIKISKINPNNTYDKLLDYEKKILNSIVNICTKGEI